MQSLTLKTAALNFIMALDDLDQYHQKVNYEDGEMAPMLEKKNRAYMDALTYLKEQAYTEMGLFNVAPKVEAATITETLDMSEPMLRYQAFRAELDALCTKYQGYIDPGDAESLVIGLSDEDTLFEIETGFG